MKTNIELAREAGLQLNVFVEKYPVIAGQFDRYTALVEARLMAKLLEGAGEPVAKFLADCADGSLVQLYEDLKQGTLLFTPDQIAAAVLREREECASLCEEKVTHPPGHGGRWDGYGPVVTLRTGLECAADIRNRGAK
jgi:hypothetical protein